MTYDPYANMDPPVGDFLPNVQWNIPGTVIELDITEVGEFLDPENGSRKPKWNGTVASIEPHNATVNIGKGMPGPITVGMEACIICSSIDLHSAAIALRPLPGARVRVTYTGPKGTQGKGFRVEHVGGPSVSQQGQPPAPVAPPVAAAPPAPVQAPPPPPAPVAPAPAPAPQVNSEDSW